MIRFENVSFAYGNRTVLEDLNFSIHDEERVAILGGSGEGKTTILKLIIGLLAPDSGKIYIDGEDIAGKSEEELRGVRTKFSMVFQDGALFDSLSVKENVAFPLREYTKMTEEEIDRKVRDLLKRVGLEEAIGQMPEELSGGMQRRVAIMRAMAAFEPKMFLYDEATTGLDPISADVICRLILEIADQGGGFILVTHKMFDAFRLARRFMFLKGGRIVFDGDREALLRSTLPEIRIFLRELNLEGNR
ncbi:MAG: ATP-binding cassette domain-containing protein [Desulfobacterota bacterium]|nr:ATP-binding cassette domain-containing protein [Thermodesulfobacteriota bacterium]